MEKYLAEIFGVYAKIENWNGKSTKDVEKVWQ